jgi:hypothetical protein
VFLDGVAVATAPPPPHSSGAWKEKIDNELIAAREEQVSGLASPTWHTPRRGNPTRRRAWWRWR